MYFLSSCNYDYFLTMRWSFSTILKVICMLSFFQVYNDIWYFSFPMYLNDNIICIFFSSLAVLIMVSGLIIFPLGLDSRYARAYCGSRSRMYHADACELGWGYMLGIMGTGLAMFCPFLSQYTDMKVHEAIYV